MNLKLYLHCFQPSVRVQDGKDSKYGVKPQQHGAAVARKSARSVVQAASLTEPREPLLLLGLALSPKHPHSFPERETCDPQLCSFHTATGMPFWMAFGAGTKNRTIHDQN